MTAEVFVITSDTTFDHPQATVLYDTGGPAHKRNVGTLRSTADTVVYLDDDVEVSPYCFYELWRFLEEHPQCGMAFGKIYKMEAGRRDEFDACGSWLTWTGFLYDRAGNARRDSGQYDEALPILASKSATCAIRKPCFERVGGFDATYYILGEETDLAWRCWLSGWEVWYVPTAVSWHAFGCETLKPKADYYTIRRTMTYGCRNYLSLLWTNLGPLRLATIFPVHLSAWLVAALGFAVRGDRTRAVAVLRGLFEFAYRLPTLHRKRRRVQSTRTCTDRDLWPLIARSPGMRYYLNRLMRYWKTQLHG